MTRRRTALSVGTLVLLVLVAVAVFVPMPYVVMSPGVTENTLGSFRGHPVITVKGHQTYPTAGHLDLTTVSVTSPDSHPRLPDVLRAWWSSNEIVLPRDVVYPPQQSVAAVNKQNQTEMLDSQTYAVAAGLKEAGIDAIKVEVAAVQTGTPADGVLQKSDEILAFNGAKVDSTQALVDAISAKPPGSHLQMEIQRGTKTMTVAMTTVAAPDDPTKSHIGVQLFDAFKPPFSVKIALGQDIGGPSAGLMFSLGVYDMITPGKLTGGRYIAGTGTIDPEGVVGPIGGIQQKIAGAYANGARVFLVPASNCAEAGQSTLAGKIDLIKVSTVDGAVKALEAFDKGSSSSLPRCGS
jgi:PDZ domain-containing protein